MPKIAHLAGLGVVPGASARLEDPKVAAWMLQPSDKERNLSNLAMNFDHLTGNEVGFSWTLPTLLFGKQSRRVINLSLPL